MNGARAWMAVLVLLLPVALHAQAPEGDHVHDHAPQPADAGVDAAADAEAGATHAHGATVTAPRTPIPPLTATDRAAAVPPAGGHAAHDDAIHAFLLADQLEWRRARAEDALVWDVEGWTGTDLNRIWLRSHGERSEGSTRSARIEMFHGRSFSAWWDLLLGLRHDPAPGPSRTFAAIGVQGLAPQWLETRVTAYVGEGGRAAAEVQVEYELLFTNRLVLQPLVEVQLWSKDDAARGIGSGLSKAEAGLRLRYEITRRIAPYIGVSHARVFGDTRQLRLADNGHGHETAFLAGLRLWF